MSEKVSELLHGPFKTDDFASYIYGQNDKIGGDNPVLEIRGWGYLTGNGHGALGLDHAAAVAEQKRFAQFVVDALNAASPSPPKADGPGEVSVKPLEWNPQDADGSGEEAWLEAQTPFGPYTITYVEHHTLHYMLEPFRSDLDSNYETEQAARLAAAADYEARILSALVSPSIKREA